jgi:hypothetical protein
MLEVPHSLLLAYQKKSSTSPTVSQLEKFNFYSCFASSCISELNPHNFEQHNELKAKYLLSYNTALITLSYLQRSICSDTLLTEPLLLQFCEDFCCSNYVLSIGACNMHKGPF